jgi:hypothetical protein
MRAAGNNIGAVLAVSQNVCETVRRVPDACPGDKGLHSFTLELNLSDSMTRS